MVSESEKQAANLAVSRFGADRLRVKQALLSALQAQAQGQPADFLDILAAENQLPAQQANDLRKALDITQFDPTSPAWSGGKPNGRSKTAPPDAVPPLPPAPTRDGDGVASPSSVADLRTLGEYH